MEEIEREERGDREGGEGEGERVGTRTSGKS